MLGLFMAITFAGAVQFCEAHPSHILCRRASGVNEIHMTDDRVSLLHRLAQEGVRNYRRDPPGVDLWAVEPPDVPGDCKKRALWQAQEIDRLDPEMARAMLPVSYSELGADGQPVASHLLLLIRSDRGLVVLDSQFDEPRIATEAEFFSADGLYLAPVGSIGGRWLQLVQQPPQR